MRNEDTEIRVSDERIIELFPARRRLVAGIVVGLAVLSVGTVVVCGVWRVVEWVWR